MMLRTTRCAVALAALFAATTARSALAWNYEGHMVVAEIAYQQLDAADKAAITKLLKAHPHYGAYLTVGAPTAGAAQDELAFVKAATWPDAVRPPRAPYKPLIIDPKDEKNVTQYHHAEWHYINIAFVLPGDANAALNNKAMNSEKGDVITTIRTRAAEIAKDVPDETRAIDIAWVMHTVGDLHQPLHAVTLIGGTFAPPDGDRGGNSVLVSPPTAPGATTIVEPLHSLWDGALGTVEMEKFTAESLPELRQKAKDILGRHPQTALPQLKQHVTPEDWAQESFELAKKDVYINGDILKLPKPRTAYQLPQEYMTHAAAVADSQAALAGYRLAATLHAALKAMGTRPAPTSPAK